MVILPGLFQGAIVNSFGEINAYLRIWAVFKLMECCLKLILCPHLARMHPMVYVFRELLRWELRRVCCGGVPILPSWVKQQVTQWTSDNGRVDVARLRHSKMSWKVEMLEKIDVQHAVETLEGGELPPHFSSSDSRFWTSSPDSEFCHGRCFK